MTTQDKARQLMVEDRQHEEHLQETMTARATETELTVAESLDEQARERLTEGRQQEKNLEENMLSRASEPRRQ